MQENKTQKRSLTKRVKNRHTRTFAVPHIGMRIIKTAVAVFICFLTDRWHGNPPLIAAFAAVICMQASFQQTLENGKQRMWGTLLGGIFGGLTLWFFELTKIPVTSLWFHLVVALLIIPLIYITVLMEQRSAVALAAIVFLVICFYHGQDSNPFELAFNRTASTFLGIVVAGVVNAVLPGQLEETKP
jgi:uncharacterized membrane protein YgaE (UPF0421/DUF939 family)